MDHNANVEIKMWEDDDVECAEIKIRSIGGVFELRFKELQLSAVGKFASSDINRIFNAIKLAEEKRVDPDPRTIECIDYISSRIGINDEDKTKLSIDVELDMPIAAGESVILKSNPIEHVSDSGQEGW